MEAEAMEEEEIELLSLVELSAKMVAEHLPFEYVEKRFEHLPEAIKRQIIHWSFPRNEQHLRLYDLVSGDGFEKSEKLCEKGYASGVYQVGFTLHGRIKEINCCRKEMYYECVTIFDRCKITAVHCSCETRDIFWCNHALTLVLFRIRYPEKVEIRDTISDSLSSLDKQQIQKLVQAILDQHFANLLPLVRKLIDELREPSSEINQIRGAPDPTAGGCINLPCRWHMDESRVKEQLSADVDLKKLSRRPYDHYKTLGRYLGKIMQMINSQDPNGMRLLDSMLKALSSAPDTYY